MKIIYVTDLHGAVWKYERISYIAEQYKADIVINGGDMLPKKIDLHKQDLFITGFLDSQFKKYNDSRIHYLCFPGNDDLKIYDDLFDDICNKYEFINDIAQRKVKIGDHEFIGMNYVVDYPFQLKDRCRMDTDDYTFQHQFGKGVYSTEDGWKYIDDWFIEARKLPTIEEEMKNLPLPDNINEAIYVIHMPPVDCGFDVCGNGTKVGSRSVYDFIKERQPKLTLHGHIHESPDVSGIWMNEIGDTICIQPGQMNDLSYVSIDTDTMEIERIVLSKE